MKEDRYMELDFTEPRIEPVGHTVYCDDCGTEHWILQAGIWQCDVCNSFNHKDLEA